MDTGFSYTNFCNITREDKQQEYVVHILKEAKPREALAGALSGSGFKYNRVAQGSLTNNKTTFKSYFTQIQYSANTPVLKTTILQPDQTIIRSLSS